MSTCSRSIKRVGIAFGTLITIIVWISVFIFDTILYSMLKMKNIGILKYNDKTLNYYFNNEIYSIRIPIQRGPKKVLSIFDEQRNSVYEKVKPYLGPNEDFHNQITTPATLGYKMLYFVLLDKEILFEENDTIVLK
jgi:hypothetical protein